MKKFFALVLSVLLVCSSISFLGCSEEASKGSGEVSLKYIAPEAIIEGLKNGTLDYGLIAEPAATNLMGTDEWEIMDVQKLYNSQTKGYPQAVFMVKNEVLEAYPQLITEIQTKFSENVGWAKENKATAVSAVQSVAERLTPNNQTSLAPAAELTDEAIDRCKIEWQSAQDAKASVNGYIADIRQIPVGLGIPSAQEVGDEFFYTNSSFVGQAIENKTFNFVVPDGAPALAIAKFISEQQNFVNGATFNYKVVSADAIAGYMNGSFSPTADFMILPIKAATINYKMKYTMVSVITHGNLYLISKTQSVTGLVGKKVGVMGGENEVPDVTLKVILKKNGLKYKTIV